MPTSWEALQKQLQHSIRTLDANRLFRTEISRHPILGHFSEPAALVAHCRSSGGDLDEKDRLLAELVRWSRSPERGDLGASILWLSLWPALDRIFRASIVGTSSERDLVSILSAAFTEVIARVSIGRCRRLAATLVRNTERRVGEDLRRERRHRDRFCATEEASRPGVRAQPARHALFQRQIATDSRAVLTTVYEWMRSTVGADAELLFAVHVLGESQGEAGRRLRLTPAAARKRLERARKILLEHLSHFGFETRVSPVGADRVPRGR